MADARHFCCICALTMLHDLPRCSFTPPTSPAKLRLSNATWISRVHAPVAHARSMPALCSFAVLCLVDRARPTHPVTAVRVVLSHRPHCPLPVHHHASALESLISVQSLLRPIYFLRFFLLHLSIIGAVSPSSPGHAYVVCPRHQSSASKPLAWRIGH